MKEYGWCEILLLITAITVLIKMIKERYDNLYGRKR
jgi:hypothetical protein